MANLSRGLRHQVKSMKSFTVKNLPILIFKFVTEAVITGEVAGAVFPFWTLCHRKATNQEKLTDINLKIFLFTENFSFKFYLFKIWHLTGAILNQTEGLELRRPHIDFKMWNNIVSVKIQG